jgi:hypothetical protein
VLPGFKTRQTNVEALLNPSRHRIALFACYPGHILVHFQIRLAVSAQADRNPESSLAILHNFIICFYRSAFRYARERI